MASTFAVCLLGLLLSPALAAADVQQQILSSVLLVVNGDKTPEVSPTVSTLTPLGAQQMYSLGDQFRTRYLVSPADTSGIGTQILAVSPYQYTVSDMDILTTVDQFNIASAQAFMQGLYPPLVTASGYVEIEGSSLLANMTNVVAPLNGYQYPEIVSVSTLDPNSIYIEGMDDCPAHDASVSEYFATSQYMNLQQSSQAFYDSLQENILNGVFIDGSIGYDDAYAIWDYLNYVQIHNSTAASYVTDDVLAEARDLVDQWAFAMYGDLSALSLTGQAGIRAIAGRAFANRVLRLLYTNIDTSGAYCKLNLMFTTYETMLSFASLAQLSSNGRSQFNSMPNVGSIMAFELFSLVVEQDGLYPDSSNMYIRFMFQNGTDDELSGYPMFGRGNDEIVISLNDFVTGMEGIETKDTADWCNACNSYGYTVFCPALEGRGGQNPSSGSGSGIVTPSASSGLKPVVAGVIGAVVTLVVLGLLIAALMLLGGIRLFRKRTDRRSDLNGFKGGEKLASDQDLTLPKGSAGATVGAVAAGPSRGHERVGSWELHDQDKAKEAQIPTMPNAPFAARRPSFEDDDLNVNSYNRPVRPRDSV